MKKLTFLAIFSLFLPIFAVAHDAKELPAWKKRRCYEYVAPLPQHIEEYAQQVARELGVQDVVFYKSNYKNAHANSLYFNKIGFSSGSLQSLIYCDMGRTEGIRSAVQETVQQLATRNFLHRITHGWSELSLKKNRGDSKEEISLDELRYWLQHFTLFGMPMFVPKELYKQASIDLGMGGWVPDQTEINSLNDLQTMDYDPHRVCSKNEENQSLFVRSISGSCAPPFVFDEPQANFKRVLYHELCHVKYRHSSRAISFAALSSIPVTVAIYFLVKQNKDKFSKISEALNDGYWKYILTGCLYECIFFSQAALNSKEIPAFPGNLLKIYNLSQEMEAELGAHYYLFKRDGLSENLHKFDDEDATDGGHPTAGEHARYIDELLHILEQNPETDESIVRELSWKYFWEKMLCTKMVDARGEVEPGSVEATSSSSS